MREGDRPVHIAILAGPVVTASTLYGMIDLFSGAGRDWAFITKGEVREPLVRPYVVARSVEPFRAANGVCIHPEFALEDCPPPDVICIPDFFVNPGESVSGQYDAEARWLAENHKRGVILASACSGAVLIGEAGLLANCDATSTGAISRR